MPSNENITMAVYSFVRVEFDWVLQNYCYCQHIIKFIFVSIFKRNQTNLLGLFITRYSPQLLKRRYTSQKWLSCCWRVVAALSMLMLLLALLLWLMHTELQISAAEQVHITAGVPMNAGQMLHRMDPGCWNWTYLWFSCCKIITSLHREKIDGY